MPRRHRTPSYRLHKPSGQAVVTLDGRDIYTTLMARRSTRRPNQGIRRLTRKNRSKVQKKSPNWADPNVGRGGRLKGGSGGSFSFTYPPPPIWEGRRGRGVDGA